MAYPGDGAEATQPPVRSSGRYRDDISRSRSFGGCFTCRKRHVKCDELQPVCLQCTQARIPCGGYKKDIFFGADSGTPGGSNQVLRFRRPLLTEAERRRMSRWLTKSVAPRAVGRALTQLDGHGEEMASMAETAVDGPFGVFRIQVQQQQQTQQQNQQQPVSPEQSLACEGTSPDFVFTDLENYLDQDVAAMADMPAVAGTIDCPDSNPPLVEQGAAVAAMVDPLDGLTPISRGLVQSLFDQAGHMEQLASDMPSSPLGGTEASLAVLMAPLLDAYGADLALDTQAPPSPDLELSLAAISHATTAADKDKMNLKVAGYNTKKDDDEALPPPPEPHLLEEEDGSRNFDLPSLFAVGMPAIAPSREQQALLQQAVPLLQHYGRSVVAFMSPLRHDRTPWHVIFLPHVKSCLAAFALRETLGVASLTIFYGTLAASASALADVSGSDVWREPARAFHQLACRHARAVLEAAYTQQPPESPVSGTDAASSAGFLLQQQQHMDYEEALMALLTMAQVSVFLGRRQQTEGFLLEAERLVRLRGLARRKSRTVRLLHHCYAYMRLLHESTFLGAAALESAHRRQVRRAVEHSGLLGHIKDNLSFRLLQWSDLTQAMGVAKTQLEGENDLHIALPGLYPATMYPEIFGIPEDFFFYLSQVIRLANERDLAERGEGCDNNLRDFARKARSLERAIDALHACPAASPAASRHVLPDVLGGMQAALSIYFLRRVYDVSTALLQPRVVAVRDWLVHYERAHPDLLYGSFCLVWPAFIAACEAEAPDLQASFARWYHVAGRRSGLACFAETLHTIERVWQAKRAAAAAGHGHVVTWVDILQEETLHFTT